MYRPVCLMMLDLLTHGCYSLHPLCPLCPLCLRPHLSARLCVLLLEERSSASAPAAAGAAAAAPPGCGWATAAPSQGQAGAQAGAVTGGGAPAALSCGTLSALAARLAWLLERGGGRGGARLKTSQNLKCGDIPGGAEGCVGGPGEGSVRLAQLVQLIETAAELRSAAMTRGDKARMAAAVRRLRGHARIVG
jgi:hypothetical protein